MKIIFLDFDGVITTEKSFYNLDNDKCDMIQSIINETGAKVVITSSWRRNDLDETIKYLYTISDRVPFVVSWIDDIIGVTSRMYGFKLSDKGEHFRISRGEEIYRWLEENEDLGVDSYVILDDDADMLYHQKDNFIHTCSFDGMTRSNMYEAIRILNKND